MRTIIFLLVLLPAVSAAQMILERLAKRDSVTAIGKKETHGQILHATSIADTQAKEAAETAASSSETLIPAKQAPAPLSSFEFWLSVIILSFTLIFVLAEVWLIRSNLLSAESSLRAILVTLIIGATLFLITAGYSNDQIAPAMGLFGTIAGYLLGKNTSAKEKEG